MSKVLKPIGKILSVALPFIPIPGIAGLSPLLTKALLSGGIGGLTGGKGFDIKRALTSGLMSYGLGSLAQGSGAAGSAGAVSGANAGQGLASNIDPAALEGGMSASQVATNVASMPVTAAAGVPPAATAPMQFKAELPAGAGPMDYVKQTGENIGAAAKGIGSMVTGAPGATEAFGTAMPTNPITNKPISPTTAGTAAYMGYTATQTVDELNKQKEEADRILRLGQEADEKDRQWAENLLRTYPIEYRRLTGADIASGGFAGGGIAALGMAGGGQPRFLSGGGDGMSDSIPASIEGKQPARLADGEFVIPADVVSHIGNGSSKAGAKQLYKMMDRVRMARTGRKQQAPQVKTQRMMPA